MVYLVGEVHGALTIRPCRGGLDEQGAILTHLEIRVIERIDVDGQSTGVLRQVGAASDSSEAEARRVIIAHLRLIISDC